MIVIRGVRWLWHILSLLDKRLQPPRKENASSSLNDDLLAFVLMMSVITCLIFAVLEVGWVPEDGVVIPTASLGLVMGVVLAKRPLRWQSAWIFITLYGFLITFIFVAKLWPPLLPENDFSLRAYWLQNGALFFDSTSSWFRAVFSGGSSRETIVFALGLGLLTWFVSAYSGWSTFRQHKPLHGVTLMGIGMALNGYFGNAELYWIAILWGWRGY